MVIRPEWVIITGSGAVAAVAVTDLLTVLRVVLPGVAVVLVLLVSVVRALLGRAITAATQSLVVPMAAVAVAAQVR
jgi:hypothetical protein